MRTTRRKSPGKPVSRAESGQARCIGASARSARGAQVLVDGLAADAELTGQCCLRGTVAGPLMQFGHLLLAEGLPAAAVRAALLGQLDPFALPFADQGTFDYVDNAGSASTSWPTSPRRASPLMPN